MVCVEPIANYSKNIKKASNTEVITSTFDKFTSKDKFDLITAFGVMHYFNTQEALKIYKHLRNFVKNHSKLIIRNHFGLDNKVTINKFSDELNMHYFSEYRTVKEEVSLLDSVGFNYVDLVDIYPSSANRFTDTHHYVLVVEFNESI